MAKTRYEQWTPKSNARLALNYLTRMVDPEHVAAGTTSLSSHLNQEPLPAPTPPRKKLSFFSCTARSVSVESQLLTGSRCKDLTL